MPANHPRVLSVGTPSDKLEVYSQCDKQDAHTSTNQVLHENKLPTHGDKEDGEPESIHTHIDLLGDARHMFELFDQGVKHTPP
ncbi:hypothetical protein PIB30_107289, partial [Stylosanthes scabra]|nr:hypothetical protein [Stylosanthes scabra]